MTGNVHSHRQTRLPGRPSPDGSLRHLRLPNHRVPGYDQQRPVDKTARRVWINGEEKAFTTKEFDLLTFLAENPNHVFTKEELFSKIQVGDKVEGTVKNVTDFGAFIDLGGADGLLHISEMSWGRIENPKKVFKVGDKVTALIKDINGEKIALSMKFPETNPWADAAEKYAVGNVVTGKVARMTDFGAFVELEPGVDALLHVSQISREHVAKPADVLSIGQEITAKIVDFNEADRKISLSMKALEADNAQEQTEE